MDGCSIGELRHCSMQTDDEQAKSEKQKTNSRSDQSSERRPSASTTVHASTTNNTMPDPAGQTNCIDRSSLACTPQARSQTSCKRKRQHSFRYHSKNTHLFLNTKHNNVRHALRQQTCFTRQCLLCSARAWRILSIQYQTWTHNSVPRLV